jgi:hypothetical protein
MANALVFEELMAAMATLMNAVALLPCCESLVLNAHGAFGLVSRAVRRVYVSKTSGLPWGVTQQAAFDTYEGCKMGVRGVLEE